jgi:hypothetical protein
MKTRTALRRIAAALNDFAKEQGWNRSDYRILFRVLEDWGRITIFFIVKEFGGLSRNEMWARVTDHLDQSMSRDGETGFSIGISVRTFDQVAKGGSNSIPEGYVEDEVVLGATAGE